ncbi:aquaporin [Andreprevotia chitinilytica]|uniref:aquaporin n=1 Tax=Andreprevotia chitinilytica TaxID=396808 RepID=UPI000555F3F4|nr:MIP/aquaporin family protein [Andreprevotia chitinilytica]
MPPRLIVRQLLAEALGTLLLLAIVVGSGIMAERLANGNVAVALLANALATGGGLIVLIQIFGPVSGAHFNPAVSLVMRLAGKLGNASFFAYIVAQVIGAIAGVWLAHAMFGEPIWQLSTKLRAGPAQDLSEFVATFGLVLTIFGGVRFVPEKVAQLVAAYIVAAYWFTASTSFANPAVTLARSLSNTFAGIAPQNVAPFVLAQLAGALAAWWTAKLLFPKPETV